MRARKKRYKDFHYTRKLHIYSRPRLKVERGLITVYARPCIKEEEIEQIIDDFEVCIAEAVKKEYYLYTDKPLRYKYESYPTIVCWYHDFSEELIFRKNRFILRLKDFKLKKIRKHYIEFLKERTYEEVTKRIEHYSKVIQKRPKQVKIEPMMGRWAACSNLGNMKFHYKCALLPDDIIDYVVVHELSHLIYMDHSEEYWHEVARMMPDYKKRRNWLDTKGASIISNPVR
ncbi:MAG TPA: hypothetical protein DHN33_02250 [Eubacteriaceae bacterium]|nr:hypothetical protein [Eubacteriaceae bacterium]